MTETVKGALNRLVAPTRKKREPLPTPPPATPIGAGEGFASPQAAEASPSNGGGIAAPLTEKAYATREFHPEMTLATSDGIFTASIKPYKKLYFTDAGGSSVPIILSPPDTPAP